MALIPLINGKMVDYRHNPVREVEPFTYQGIHNETVLHGILVIWNVFGDWPEAVIHPVSGTLELLLRNPDTPPGVWIDRLEECPEELEVADPNCYPLIIDFLRRQYPDGFLAEK